MKGTRRQPSADSCVSDLKPITARNGANSSGSEIMIPTSEAGTSSSTIMTRLSVPTSSVNAMPTDTWNKESRSRRPSGKSGVATSAKGRKRGPRLAHVRITLRLIGFMSSACPIEA